MKYHDHAINVVGEGIGSIKASVNVSLVCALGSANHEPLMMGPRIITNSQMIETINKPKPYKMKWWQHLIMYTTPFNPHWPVTPIRWETSTVPSKKLIHDNGNNVIYCHPAMKQRLLQEITSLV